MPVLAGRFVLNLNKLMKEYFYEILCDGNYVQKVKIFPEKIFRFTLNSKLDISALSFGLNITLIFTVELSQVFVVERKKCRC